MSHWDWNRVSYVLFVLAVFAALVKVGGMTLADANRSLPQTASAAPAAADPEPPWYMGTFLELEDDRGFVGEALATERAASRSDVPGESSKGPSGAASSDAPVFYRPSEPGREPEPVCGNLSAASPDGRAVFPLARAYFTSYGDTWGAPRPQGGHEGTDLMVPAGTPEYAITDGTVVAVSGANENGWNTLGGYTVMIEANRTVGPIRAGDLFYYAHLQAPSELPIGTRVQAGQLVGRAGDTGQGPEVTEGLFPAHLHLGWYDGSGGRTEVESGAMNPFPLLQWLEANGGSVSGGSDARYCEAPQTGGPQPSTGGQKWPTPPDPGQRPDLDTGADHAHPSPAAGRPDPRESDPREGREESREEPRDARPGPRDPRPDPDAEPGPDRPETDPDDDGRDPEDGTPGAPEEQPPGGVRDLPRIIDDGKGGLGGLPPRLRDRIQDLFPGLFPDPKDRNPGPDRDEGGKKDPRDPPDRDGDPRNDPSGNDDPRPEEPPERPTSNPDEAAEETTTEGPEDSGGPEDQGDDGATEGEDPEGPTETEPERTQPETAPEE